MYGNINILKKIVIYIKRWFYIRFVYSECIRKIYIYCYLCKTNILLTVFRKFKIRFVKIKRKLKYLRLNFQKEKFTILAVSPKKLTYSVNLSIFILIFFINLSIFLSWIYLNEQCYAIWNNKEKTIVSKMTKWIYPFKSFM